MSDFINVKKSLIEKRERALNGLYNCIPLPFARFRTFFPGTQMGKYIIVTANQKVGKTKFCDFLYIYEVLFFNKKHHEMIISQIMVSYLCFLYDLFIILCLKTKNNR